MILRSIFWTNQRILKLRVPPAFPATLMRAMMTETKQDFIPVVISADDEDDGSSISWRYTLSNTHISVEL